VLVQQGTLKRGDAIVVGCASGKLRAMMDDTGKLLDSAGPSTAVEVTGLDAVPDAGDTLNVVESAEVAREVAGHRVNQRRTQEQVGGNMSLEDLMRRMQGQAGLELKIVLKADVQGSVEAVRGALLKLATDEVKVNVIYGGVGAIKESDIMLAAASGGIVLGFGVRPDTNARIISEREGVEVRTYTIIYEAIDDVRRAMEGLLTPESREKVVGRAEVRDLFKVSKVGTIGGSRVLEGKAMRSARVRVLRDSVQIYEGKVSSLRHFKNDVREVDTGLECGIGVEGYNDLKAGDVIEFFTIEEVARTLSPAAGAPSKRGAAPAYEAHP
jgi:translation initiation factor IF-2